MRREQVRTSVKYQVIYRHRMEYPVCRTCRFFEVSESGYYDFVRRIGRPEKAAGMAEVIAEQRELSFRTYGYRRRWLWPERQGKHRNPKAVLRIMKKYGLLSEIRRRKRWTQMGQQVHKYENLLNREFHADRPNSKWVTDISYIQAMQGVLYLSRMRALYDNSSMAYKTAAQQAVKLVPDTIRLAMKQKKRGSPQSCTSTAARISVHLSSILPTCLKNTALPRPGQGRETVMTTLWQKTSTLFPRRHVSTAASLLPFSRPTICLIASPTSTTTSVSG